MGVELGSDVSAEELVASLERTQVRLGGTPVGHVPVLDLLRARTRRAEVVFILGLEEGTLPRRAGASAFLDDPVFRWLVPDAAVLSATIEPCFDLFAEAFARHDETHLLTAYGVTAAAIMLSPPGVAPVYPRTNSRRPPHCRA